MALDRPRGNDDPGAGGQRGRHAAPTHTDPDSEPLSLAEIALAGLRQRHPDWVVFGMAGKWWARHPLKGWQVSGANHHLMEQEMVELDACEATERERLTDPARPYIAQVDPYARYRSTL